ncbi:MAG TPA: hypothetical protein DIC52_05530 [Candidatus Latescibacteria bacterium]|nr:hypothetical protein [Candidatus Latescibacterota bacterium]
MDDLRANGIRGYVLKGLSRLARTDYRQSVRSSVVREGVNYVTMLPTHMGQALVLGVSGWLFL